MSRAYVTGKGGHNATCDVCGFQYKNFELKKRWDGKIVCRDDYELRHPQEFLRPIRDNFPLPWTRLESLQEIPPGFFIQTYSPSSITSVGVPRTFGMLAFHSEGSTPKHIAGLRFWIGTPGTSSERQHRVGLRIYREFDSALLYSKNEWVREAGWVTVPITPSFFFTTDVGMYFCLYTDGTVPIGYVPVDTSKYQLADGITTPALNFGIGDVIPTNADAGNMLLIEPVLHFLLA